MRKNWLFPLLLSLVFFVFILVRSEKGVRLDLQATGDSFIDGIKIVHKKNGNSDWVLTARRADITKGGDEAVLQDLKLAMQDRALTVYADQGVYGLEDKNIQIIGKIAAEGRQVSVETSDVSFDNNNNMMTTGEPVMIKGKKFVVQGRGFEANTLEEKMRIFHDVQATFYR